MKHLDLFSGYGGFSIACERLGIETIGFSEIEKNANAVLNYHYPNIKNYGNISEITNLPDFDLLTGGSPCQDLSVAGKQKGLSGERSGLFFQFIRLLKEKQPANFIWENVKGTISSQNGWDFARVQIEMAESGYGFQWQVLNAKYFGVPQSRQRVFVIGHLGGKCPREIFFEQTDGGKNLRELTKNASQCYRVYDSEGIACTQASQAGGVGAKTGLYTINPKMQNYKLNDVAPTITASCHKEPPCFVDLSTNSSKLTEHSRAIQARYAKGYSKHSGEISGVYMIQRPRGNNVGGIKEMCPTISVNSFKDNNHLAIPVLTPDRIEKRQDGRRFKEDGEEMFTLTKQDKHGIYNGVKIRRLTPRECEKLMGLSVDWTKYGIEGKGLHELSDNARYKLCGNGVVVNVVEEIIKRLMQCQN